MIKVKCKFTPLRSKTKGDHAFTAALLKLWNSLAMPIRGSSSIQGFKSTLNTSAYHRADCACVPCVGFMP